jgi:hypothetical protein
LAWKVLTWPFQFGGHVQQLAGGEVARDAAQGIGFASGQAEAVRGLAVEMRMLAKVPRIMTSWLPRRAP